MTTVLHTMIKGGARQELRGAVQSHAATTVSNASATDVGRRDQIQCDILRDEHGCSVFHL
jgi:hypothetical protein